MRIAYIISAYKLLEQVARLVRRVHDADTSIFIHVDKRSGPIDALVAATEDLSNVSFLDRHACAWGSFGPVAATLKGIRAVGQAGRHDYVLPLTGQDYPIKTKQHIQDFLAAAAGRSFMDYFPLPSPEWEGGGLARIERWHIYARSRHLVFPPRGWRFPKRRFPAGLRPFGGSSHWCLASECVQYVQQFVAANPRFVSFLRYVGVPDELFFQTLLLNSPLRDRIVNDNLRYIDWRDLLAGSPVILTSQDFSALQASPKLFARKFDATADSEILDRIDEELLQVGSR
jgi:hypothetical protein